MDKREVLKRALEEELRIRNWQQQDLANRCGLSSGTVSNLLLMKGDASPATIRRLAECLDWSIVALDQLYYGKVSKEEEFWLTQINHRLRPFGPQGLQMVYEILRIFSLVVLPADGKSSVEGAEGSGAEGH